MTLFIIGIFVACLSIAILLFLFWTQYELIENLNASNQYLVDQIAKLRTENLKLRSSLRPW